MTTSLGEKRSIFRLVSTTRRSTIATDVKCLSRSILYLSLHRDLGSQNWDQLDALLATSFSTRRI